MENQIPFSHVTLKWKMKIEDQSYFFSVFRYHRKTVGTSVNTFSMSNISEEPIIQRSTTHSAVGLRSVEAADKILRN